MQELSLQEVQKIELNLLTQFDQICRGQEFRYSLAGGSLIGAVRHQGFIPWDDDIDVIMPRPDYDRFIKYCQTEKIPFQLMHYETDEHYNSLITKILDPKTKLVDEVTPTGLELGVNIDVFPVEGLGRSKKEALRLYRKTEWSRELLNAAAWGSFQRSKTHRLILEPVRFVLFVISRFISPKKLLRKVERIHRECSFDHSQFAGDVCGSYRRREIMEQPIFADYMDIPFENCYFRVMKRYHDFLTNIYGDYMMLPPPEQRKTHHTFKAYRVSE